MVNTVHLMPSEAVRNIGRFGDNIIALAEGGVRKLTRTPEVAYRLWQRFSTHWQEVKSLSFLLLPAALPAAWAQGSLRAYYRLNTLALDNAIVRHLQRQTHLQAVKNTVRNHRSLMGGGVKCIIGRAECYAIQLKPYVPDLGMRSWFSNVLARIYAEFPQDCKNFLQKAKEYDVNLYDLVDAHREIISPPCNATSGFSTSSSFSPSGLSTTPSSPSSKGGVGFAQLMLYSLGAGFIIFGVYAMGKLLLSHKDAVAAFSTRVKEHASTTVGRVREMLSQGWYILQAALWGSESVGEFESVVSDEEELGQENQTIIEI